ncbi:MULTISPECIES: ash family protein [Symbiopectobacterium]|uniref:ash family protein n=1 Tax=Symbiopectobacterium TaxID=801 RepID=UPI001A1A78BA|nr:MULTISPECIES: ash family protein [Symbiopectobacterium]MBG6248369.1 hypothetical protein [Candidatus Symbiopectobacterium sp. PLON1]MBT9430280.1 ash family protein [Candidatus Symbiopectobacterium endolongispinus]
MNNLDLVNFGRYSPLAAAKSAAGICNQGFNLAHNRAHCVFLCAVHGYTSQWWGVQGSERLAGF